MKNTIDEKDTIRDNVGASVAPETVDLRSGTGVAPETVNMRPRNAVQPTELGNKPAGVRRSTRATASALVAALLLLALGGVIGYRFAFYKIENDQGALRDEDLPTDVEERPTRQVERVPNDFETRPKRQILGGDEGFIPAPSTGRDEGFIRKPGDPNAKRCSRDWCRVLANRTEMCCQLE